jgi:hypothetical protein
MPGRLAPPVLLRMLAVVAAVGLGAPAVADGRRYERAGTYDALRSSILEDYDWGTMVDGVPMVRYPSGLARNPATTAQYGLAEWTLWRRDGRRRHLRNALHAADWLVFTQGRGGRWTYDFAYTSPGTDMVLPAGWSSGMAQGQAVSLLTRAYRRTHARRYLHAARRGLRTLTVTVPHGGLARRLGPGRTWFEEYPTPRPSLVLNGDLLTLVGLYDAADLDRRARPLFRAGMRAVIELLPAFDAGGGRSWYDLVQRLGYQPHVAPQEYTPLIRDMLLTLDTVYPHPRLREFAARWDGS